MWIGSLEFDSVFWKDTIDKSTTLRKGANLNKRRRLSSSSSSASVNGNRILLIYRIIYLDITDKTQYTKLVNGLDYPQATISLTVDCDIFNPPPSRERVTRRSGVPRSPSVKIYPEDESTPLLAFSFIPSDLPVDAQKDAYWTAEVWRESKKKQAPVKEFQSHTSLVLVRDEQERWTFSLVMKVTVDSTNEWSERYLALSRKKYWELLAHALPTGRPVINSDNITPRDFYLSVHVPEKTEEVPNSIQHETLSCELFPFQQRTVHWMLQREGVQLKAQKPGELVPFIYPYGSKLPPTFFSQPDKSGQPCYVSHILGIISNDLQGLLQASISNGPNSSGILAEEMGLGKTVELIALLCLHRRELAAIGRVVRDDYHNKDVKVSGATLIITPPSILHQWQSEIATHAPDLKGMTTTSSALHHF